MGNTNQVMSAPLEGDQNDVFESDGEEEAQYVRNARTGLGGEGPDGRTNEQRLRNVLAEAQDMRAEADELSARLLREGKTAADAARGLSSVRRVTDADIARENAEDAAQLTDDWQSLATMASERSGVVSDRHLGEVGQATVDVLTEAFSESVSQYHRRDVDKASDGAQQLQAAAARADLNDQQQPVAQRQQSRQPSNPLARLWKAITCQNGCSVAITHAQRNRRGPGGR